MLLFSDIVPIASTDPHVAAAAFYRKRFVQQSEKRADLTFAGRTPRTR